MAENHTEGSPWFWKIFGSSVIGMVTILLISHFGNINANIDRSFLDLRGDIKEVRQTIDSHRERLTTLEQNTYKDRLAMAEKQIETQQVAMEENKQKIAAAEAIVSSLKDDVKAMRDWNVEMTKQVQELREKVAAETAKKVDPPKVEAK